MTSANTVKECLPLNRQAGGGRARSTPIAVRNRLKPISRGTKRCVAFLVIALLGIPSAESVQSQDTEEKKEAEILIDQDSLFQRVGNCATPERPQVTTKPPELDYEIDFAARDTMPEHSGTYEFTVEITEPDWKGSVKSELTLFHSEGILITDTVHEYDGTKKAVTVLTSPPDLNAITKYRPAEGEQPWTRKPPSEAGRYHVIAEISGDSCVRGTATGTLHIKKGEQEIDFPSIRNQHVNEAPFELNAKADSGLHVRYSVTSGPATVCGEVVTFTGQTGTVVLRARQPGNENWKPAAPVVRSFEVLPSETASEKALKIHLSKGKITLSVNTEKNLEFVIERTTNLSDPEWKKVGRIVGHGSLCLERNRADTAFFRARATD